MSMLVPSLFLILAGVVSADGSPVIRSVTLAERAPMVLQDVQGKRVEFLGIDGDPSLVLRNCSNVTVFCCRLRSIRIEQSHDIAIENCWIHDSPHEGIEASGCRNLLVQGCRLESVSSGLYAVDCHDVQFIGNETTNVVGPFPRGQMVQFDSVHGGACVIRDNDCINLRGKSHPEDCINLYQSSGEPHSPILIENNSLAGDPVAGSGGKSKTGSGIMLGDSDERGGDSGGNILCRSNVIVNAGQVGLGVAGGHDIEVCDNIVIGRQSDVSRVGMYAWNQSKRPGGKIKFAGNRVSWIDKEGASSSWWNGGGFAEVKLKGNLFDDEGLRAPPLSGFDVPRDPFIRENTIELPYAVPAPRKR